MTPRLKESQLDRYWREACKEFDEKNVFIDNSLLEFIDFVFLIPMCILVMIDFLL